MEDLGHPVSYLVAKRGIPVFSSEGEKLGRVVKVLAAPEAHMFDGILFATSWGPTGRRFVDAPEVGEIYERGVILKLSASEVGSLPRRRPKGSSSG
jgi:hypothetical protein